MAEISKRLSGAMGAVKNIQRGLESGGIVLREVQKMNADGTKAGKPSLALVGAVTGNVFAILVTQTTVTGAPRTERQYNSWTSRYDERTVPGAASPKYVVLAPA